MVERIIDRVPFPVKRESMLFILMGQPALLMQIAHPMVARAVREHSSYARQPLQRLIHTYDLSMKLFAGSDEEAREAAAAINRAHIPIKGNGYDARDPELGKWVWATLVYSVLVGHQLYFDPLSAAEKWSIFDSFARRATLIGLHRNLPSTETALYDYIEEMINSGAVHVSDDARHVARFILGPVPKSLRPLSAYPARVTLPAELRRQFGLSWSPPSRRTFHTYVRPLARRVLTRLTTQLQCLP